MWGKNQEFPILLFFGFLFVCLFSFLLSFFLFFFWGGWGVVSKAVKRLVIPILCTKNHQHFWEFSCLLYPLQSKIHYFWRNSHHTIRVTLILVILLTKHLHMGEGLAVSEFRGGSRICKKVGPRSKGGPGGWYNPKIAQK